MATCGRLCPTLRIDCSSKHHPSPLAVFSTAKASLAGLPFHSQKLQLLWGVNDHKPSIENPLLLAYVCAQPCIGVWRLRPSFTRLHSHSLTHAGEAAIYPHHHSLQTKAATIASPYTTKNSSNWLRTNGTCSKRRKNSVTYRFRFHL